MYEVLMFSRRFSNLNTRCENHFSSWLFVNVVVLVSTLDHEPSLSVPSDCGFFRDRCFMQNNYGEFVGKLGDILLDEYFTLHLRYYHLRKNLFQFC